jgi:hypothetical protein
MPEIIPHDVIFPEQLKQIFKKFYFLDNKSADMATRLTLYCYGYNSLSKKEVDTYVKLKIFNKEGRPSIPDCYYYDNYIMPAFILKCILIYNNLYKYSEREANDQTNRQQKN